MTLSSSGQIRVSKNADRYDYDTDGSPIKTVGVSPVNERDRKIKQFCIRLACTWTSSGIIEEWLYQLMADLGYENLTQMKVKYRKRIPRKPRPQSGPRSVLMCHEIKDEAASQTVQKD